MRMSDWSSDLCSSDLALEKYLVVVTVVKDRVETHLRESRVAVLRCNEVDEAITAQMRDHAGLERLCGGQGPGLLFQLRGALIGRLRGILRGLRSSLCAVGLLCQLVEAAGEFGNLRPHCRQLGGVAARVGCRH